MILMDFEKTEVEEGTNLEVEVEEVGVVVVVVVVVDMLLDRKSHRVVLLPQEGGITEVVVLTAAEVPRQEPASTPQTILLMALAGEEVHTEAPEGVTSEVVEVNGEAEADFIRSLKTECVCSHHRVAKRLDVFKTGSSYI